MKEGGDIPGMIFLFTPFALAICFLFWFLFVVRPCLLTPAADPSTPYEEGCDYEACE
jgi:hypothetical protein